MRRWKSVFKERSVAYDTLSPQEAKTMSTAQKYLLHYCKLKGMPSNKALLAIDDVLSILDFIAKAGTYSSSISPSVDNFIDGILKKRLGNK